MAQRLQERLSNRSAPVTGKIQLATRMSVNRSRNQRIRLRSTIDTGQQRRHNRDVSRNPATTATLAAVASATTAPGAMADAVNAPHKLIRA
jgi:hypothetical protein